MDNQLTLFLDSSIAYDLAVDIVGINGIDVEIQEDLTEKPSFDKDHCLYSDNFSELVVLTVSFTNLAISLASFATLVINSKAVKVSDTFTHRQSIKIGDKTIVLSNFSNIQALIDFVQEEFRYQEVLYKKQVSSLEFVASRPINIVNKAESNSMSESFNNNLQGANISNFANQLNDNARQQANQYNYASEQKQTLSEAAAEIQKLLKQLEQTNPTASEAQQIEYINDETTPKFKKRVVSALQATGEAVIDEFVLENKYLKVFKAAAKAWVKPE